MENLVFVNDENITLIIYHNKDIDYDDSNAPNTSRADQTTFKMPETKDKKIKILFKP